MQCEDSMSTDSTNVQSIRNKDLQKSQVVPNTMEAVVVKFKDRTQNSMQNTKQTET
jgi:hypothetical protein